jgi:SAM-dependent methyltransferase
MLKYLKKIYLKQQHHPTIIGVLINPFYIARKGLYRSIKELSPKITGKILDVGCGQKPYIDLFKYESYIGMDIEQSGHDHKNEKIDVFYNGKIFPFESNTFDSILCNEVFEHVFNSGEFMLEINRVLKIDGYFLISVPFMWIEHEQPYDFARYTSFGLISILERNGFQIEKQMKTVNDIRSLIQLFSAFLYEKIMTKNSVLNFFITGTIFSSINILAQLLFCVFPKSRDMYLDNVILAKKESDV